MNVISKRHYHPWDFLWGGGGLLEVTLDERIVCRIDDRS